MAIASIVGGIGFAVAASVGGAGIIAGSIGFVAFGAIVIAVVVGVVGFLLMSLLGSGDIPSGDNAGSKTRLRTDPNNLLPIPYGRTRTAGQFVGGDNNEKEDQLSAICAIGEGPIEEILSINWNDSLLYFPPNAQEASLKIMTNTKPPTYTSTDTGIPTKKLSRNNSVVNSVGRDGKDDKFLNKNMECRVYPNGNRNREMESFSPTKYGANTDKRTNPNMVHAFMRIRFDSKQQVNGFTTNLFFNIKGKKVRTFNASGVLSSPTTGVVATALVEGNLYTITDITGSDFTSAGANYNTVGEVFTATGTTTGTGTCTDMGLFYSNNPAECTLDYMTSTRYGASIPDNDINISSFFEWKKYCDEDVDYTEKVRTWLNGLSFTTGERANYRGRTFVSTQNDNMYEPANASFVLGTGWTQESTSETATRTGTAKRYTCNGTLSTSDKISKNLDYLTSGSAGILNRNNGKYQIVIRKESTKVAGSFVVGRQYVIKSLTGTTQAQWNTTAGSSGVTFTAGTSFFAATVGVGTGTADEIAAYLSEDDLIGELTITGTPLKELTNRLIIKYKDQNDFSQVRQVILDLRDPQNEYYSPTLVNESEPLVERTKSLPLVNGSVEARRNGIVAINESRQGIQTKLTTTFKHLQVEAGDIIAVRHKTPAWGWNANRTVKTAPKLFRAHSVIERVVRGAVVLDFNVVEYASESYTTGMIVQDDPAPNTGFRAFSNIPDISFTVADDSTYINEIPSSALVATWDNSSDFFEFVEGRIIKTSDRVEADATDVVEDKLYEIKTVGTTDFTLLGAPDNNVGTVFIADGTGVVGSGTGTLFNDSASPWSDTVRGSLGRARIPNLEINTAYTVQYRVHGTLGAASAITSTTATTASLNLLAGISRQVITTATSGFWNSTTDTPTSIQINAVGEALDTDDRVNLKITGVFAEVATSADCTTLGTTYGVSGTPTYTSSNKQCAVLVYDQTSTDNTGISTPADIGASLLNSVDNLILVRSVATTTETPVLTDTTTVVKLADGGSYYAFGSNEAHTVHVKNDGTVDLADSDSTLSVFFGETQLTFTTNTTLTEGQFNVSAVTESSGISGPNFVADTTDAKNGYLGLITAWTGATLTGYRKFTVNARGSGTTAVSSFTNYQQSLTRVFDGNSISISASNSGGSAGSTSTLTISSTDTNVSDTILTVQPGNVGETGADSTVAGPDGSRGAGSYSGSTTLTSDPGTDVTVDSTFGMEAQTALTADGAGSPVTGDVITLTNSTFVVSKFFDGTNWDNVAQVIDGNLVVQGTVATDRLLGNTSNDNGFRIGAGESNLFSFGGSLQEISTTGLFRSDLDGSTVWEFGTSIPSYATAVWGHTTGFNSYAVVGTTGKTDNLGGGGAFAHADGPNSFDVKNVTLLATANSAIETQGNVSIGNGATAESLGGYTAVNGDVWVETSEGVWTKNGSGSLNNFRAATAARDDGVDPSTILGTAAAAQTNYSISLNGDTITSWPSGGGSNNWDGGTTNLVATTGRTSLGLGSAAIHDTTSFASASHTQVFGTILGTATSVQLAASPSASQFLTTDGTNSSWETVNLSLDTTYASGGTDGQVLTSDGTNVAWEDAGGSTQTMDNIAAATSSRTIGGTTINLTCGDFLSSSDIRYKEGIVELTEGLAMTSLSSINPISYTLKENGSRSIGFIAQDVEKHIPELVTTDEDGMKSLNYAKMTAMLWKQNQELLKRIEVLEGGE